MPSLLCGRSVVAKWSRLLVSVTEPSGGGKGCIIFVPRTIVHTKGFVCAAQGLGGQQDGTLVGSGV